MPRTLSTPSVRFVLHIAKGREKTFCPIYAIMQKGNERYKIATGEEAKPSELDKAGVVTRGATPIRRRELETLAKRLDWWRNFLRELWEEHHAPKMGSLPPQQIEPARFRELVKVRLGEAVEAKTPDLLEFIEGYIAGIVKRRQDANTNKKGETTSLDAWQHPTVASLSGEYKRILLFSKLYGKLDYKSFTPELLKSYHAFLFKKASAKITYQLKEKSTKVFTKKAMNKESALQSIGLLKQFLRAACVAGYVSSATIEKLSMVKFTGSKSNAFFFTWRELKKIFETDLSGNPDAHNLHQTRTLLLIGCWTGMRFSDWGKVERKFVFEENNGKKWLDVITKKKNKPVGIFFLPIFERLLEIINWEIPDFSIQKFNENAKQLVKAAGINRVVMVNDSTGGIDHDPEESPLWKQVSSHCCRRTMAHLMNNMGLNMGQIQRTLAHSTQTQTAAYMRGNEVADAKSVNSSEIEAMIEFLNGKANFSNIEKNQSEFQGYKENKEVVFEYWRPARHMAMLETGWAMFGFSGSLITTDLEAAKEAVERLRKNGWARIFLRGQRDGVFRYSVLFKKK